MLMQIPTDNFISPALWSATEVAIAIFSCSIPSLTYLFRRLAGSTASATVKQIGKEPGYRSGPADARDKNVRQEGSFQRLRDEVNHVDNLGLISERQANSSSMVRGCEGDADSYGLNQIIIRHDFDVECDQSPKV